MSRPLSRPSSLLALTLASAVLAGCGAGGGTGIQRYTGCVDHDGFPVPCNTPGALPAQGHKPREASLTFALNVNGAGVTDASGDLLTFSAAEPHAATLGELPLPAVTLEASGRVRLSGAPLGRVAYIRGAQGGLVAVLVDADGRPLDLTPTADGVRVTRSADPVEPAGPEAVPAAPTESEATPR